MDKIIIDRIFSEILEKKHFESKCGRNHLYKSDKEFVENFNQNRNKYLDFEDIGLIAYNQHVIEQSKHNYTEKQIDAIQNWGNSGFRLINGRIYQTDDYKYALAKSSCIILI